jgi:hypothetical protein
VNPLYTTKIEPIPINPDRLWIQKNESPALAGLDRY